MAVLHLAARHGKLVLVLGLLTGLLAPGLALALKPWLPQMIVGLLFLNAYRIGFTATFRGMENRGSAAASVLVLQLVLPLTLLLGFSLAGYGTATLATVLILMTAAPPVTATPSLTIMLGHEPTHAFRMLILGTALLPLTIIPVFRLSPELGDLTATLLTAGRLLLAIWLSTIAAFGLRRLLTPGLDQRGTANLDGMIAIMLAVIVVGLMSALGPALAADPLRVAGWLALALAANLGLQIIAFRLLRATGLGAIAVQTAVAAGNRNFALFLVAMPASQTEPLMIFLACYQVPMYLTPILMGRVYGRPPKPNHPT